MAISRAGLRRNINWDDIFIAVPNHWTVWAEYDINTMAWTPLKIERGASEGLPMKSFLIADAVDEMDAYKQFMEKFNHT